MSDVIREFSLEDTAVRETKAIMVVVRLWLEDSVRSVKCKPLDVQIYEVIKLYDCHRDEVIAHYQKLLRESIACQITPPIITPPVILKEDLGD